MPKINQKALVFTLSNQNNQLVSLNDFQGRWIVLYFYPKDNTPGCTIEAHDFTAHLSKFTRAGAVILGVSPDSVQSHYTFIKKRKLKINLLSDENKKVLKQYKVWGKKRFMGREYSGVLRTTFLIDPRGKIVQRWKNVHAPGPAEAVLKALLIAKIIPRDFK